MAFWTDNTLKEPLRQNRWYINFASDTLKPFVWALKECQKPSYEVSFTEHRLLTHTYKYPSLLKWKPIEIKMVSARGDDGTTLDKVLNDYKNNVSGYKPPSTNLHQQISKASSELEGDGLVIIEVDDSGKPIQNWTLYNAFISNLNYGTLTYENDGFVDISFTVQYDWAEQNKL